MISQKKHFTRKLEDVTRTIWDEEFKRFKALEIREDIRKEYDNVRSKIEALTGQIKAQKDLKAKDEVKRIEDLKVQLENTKTQHEQDMERIDIQVKGLKKCAEHPHGIAGSNQMIEQLRELQSMIKTYIKTL